MENVKRTLQAVSIEFTTDVVLEYSSTWNNPWQNFKMHLYSTYNLHVHAGLKICATWLSGTSRFSSRVPVD